MGLRMSEKNAFRMQGTQGTGLFVGIVRTRFGAVACREFYPGHVRIRVEPSSERSAKRIAKILREDEGWKQPTGQLPNKNVRAVVLHTFRFSTVVNGEAGSLSAFLKEATKAIGASRNSRWSPEHPIAVELYKTVPKRAPKK